MALLLFVWVNISVFSYMHS